MRVLLVRDRRGGLAAEGGPDVVEAVGEFARAVRGRAEPFPGGGGQPAPVGVVAGPFEDLGGVAQLFGELGQHGVLLVAVAGGGQGLKEFVEGGGHRAGVVGQSVEVGVKGLGDDARGTAGGPVVVAWGGQAAQGEVDDDVAGCGVGVDLGGQGASDVVRGGCVGGREGLQVSACGVSGPGRPRLSAGALRGVWWSGP